MKEQLLPRFSVRRPVTVLMIFLALLVVGGIAAARIPLQLEPSDFDLPLLFVWVPFPDANPQEVESQIAQPSEEMFRTLHGLEGVRTSCQSNGMGCLLTFYQRTDMDLAYNEVRDRVDRLKGQLPDEVRDIYIWKYNPDDQAILWMGVSVGQKDRDTYHLLENKVRRRMQRIEGVAKVEIYGIHEPYILIDLDNEAIKSHKVNIERMYRDLSGNNFTLSSGHTTEGGKKILVRSMGQYRDLAEIENVIVPTYGGLIEALETGSLPPEEIGRMAQEGTPYTGKEPIVRLKDIAQVMFGYPAPNQVLHVDREPGITMEVFKEATANTVAVSQEVRRALAEEIVDDPQLAAFRFNVFYDQGGVILESLNTLKETMLWGGLFAVLILYLFLRRLRMTLIITAAIPISLLIALSAVYFTGETMNIVMMMGLIIAVGMVVDNAIVVVENIHRRRTQEGEAPKTAAIRGASEVAVAIIMATSTTLVVFLPLILMSDNVIMRYYMGVFGLPICYAIAASLFVALVFIPLSTVRLLGARNGGGGAGAGSGAGPPSGSRGHWWHRAADGVYERTFGRLHRLYERILGWVLDHKLITVFLAVVLFQTSMGIAEHIPKTDDAEGNIRDVYIRFDLPPTFYLRDAEAYMKEIEALVAEHEDELDIRTMYSRFGATWGSMRLFLKPYSESDLEVGDAVERIKALLPERSGITIHLGRETGEDEGISVVNVRLEGKDTATLVELARQLEARFRQIPDLLEVESGLENAPDEIRVVLQRELMQKYGVSPETVTGILSATYRGIFLQPYQGPDREVDVRLRFSPRDREDLHQLKDMPMPTREGGEVSLASLAGFDVAKGIAEIRRKDGKTALDVRVKAARKDMGSLYADVERIMAGFRMPPGYEWSRGDAWWRFLESQSSQQWVVLMAVIFVFLMMGILFESWFLPFSVMFSIPFTFFGVNWALFLTRTEFDMLVGIGVILLIGIVVNNAIVLVDRINQLRLAGLDRTAAILGAGRQRFRPIVMTALTTIFGCLPMAVGGTKIVGISFTPLGRAVVGGLFASTLSTLILVPVCYVLLEELRNILVRCFVLPFRRTRGDDPAGPSLPTR